MSQAASSGLYGSVSDSRRNFLFRITDSAALIPIAVIHVEKNYVSLTWDRSMGFFHPLYIYSYSWFSFDNQSSRKSPVAGVSSDAVPAALASLNEDSFIGC